MAIAEGFAILVAQVLPSWSRFQRFCIFDVVVTDFVI
jgi:hypothetical protein